MANPRITVPAPVRQPRRGGFLSVIPVVDVPNLAAAETVEWEANPCGIVQPGIGLCWGDVSELEKDQRQALDWGFATGFVALGYYGVECFLGDYDYTAKAREGLEEAEGIFLEHVVQETVFDSSTAPAAPAVNVAADGLIAAENFADTRYRVAGGYIARPIIWINRGDAIRYAAAFLIFGDSEGNLWTANGTPVIASGEFTPGEIWVSGQATVYRSPITDIPAQNLTLNREMAIAERVYAIGFDCLEPTFVPVIQDGYGTSITLQPEPENDVEVDAPLELTANASGSPVPTAQWQISTGDETGPWEDIVGATDYSYSPDTSEEGVFYYRVIFTNPFVSRTSDVAVVTVTAP